MHFLFNFLSNMNYPLIHYVILPTHSIHLLKHQSTQSSIHLSFLASTNPTIKNIFQTVHTETLQENLKEPGPSLPINHRKRMNTNSRTNQWNLKTQKGKVSLEIPLRMLGQGGHH